MKPLEQKQPEGIKNIQQTNDSDQFQYFTQGIN
jgi:hypothetical protein